MKNLLKFAGLLGALALGTTIASASSSSDYIRVNVPFPFVVAGKAFPAGQYTVQQTDRGLLLVRGEGSAAMTLSIPGGSVKAGTLPALHFTANNGREYLVEVNDDTSSHSLPLPATETRTLTISH
jgi:hypothetical protein